MRKILFLALALSFAAAGRAQRQYAYNDNAWLMYFGDHKVSPKLGVHLEAQLRRADFLASAQQLLLRTGLNWHFSPQAFATAGYCFVKTSPYGGFPAKAAFPESRLWEQLQLKSALGRVEWTNRLRLEQRFVKSPALQPDGAWEPGDAVYTNRARVLNRFSAPLRGKTIQEGSFYVSAYDEVFANFGKNVGANFLDQNRLYGALGYKIRKVGRLEAGYLWQTLHKADGSKIERDRTLQLGLSSTVDFFKKR